MSTVTVTFTDEDVEGRVNITIAFDKAVDPDAFLTPAQAMALTVIELVKRKTHEQQ